MSSDKIDENAASTILKNATSYISTEMVQAYWDCISFKTKDNLELNITLNSSDNDQRTVTFELVPNDEISTSINSATLQGINIVPANSFVCKGSLWDAAQNKEEIKTTLSMSCERVISDTLLDIGTKKLFAPSSSVQISTTSKGITMHFAPVIPTNPVIPQGLGDIVASMLSKEDFIYANGKDKWMLADGSPAPEGSAYYRFVSKNIPNLCGQFLRGRQHDRETGGNPDGDLPLGTESSDKTSMPDANFDFEVTNNKHTHSHVLQVGQDRGNVEVGRDAVAWNLVGGRRRVTRYKYNVMESDIAGHSVKIKSGGDNETRPTNVTVNYFIRIN